MSKQVTALVPTFNRGPLLAETLDALLLQKRALSQIIVWDDGSTDNTAEVIAPFLKDHGSTIQYERAENGGKSKALNQALALARGDYIWICDDDDIALPDAAEKLGDVLDKNPQTGLAAGRHARFSVSKASGDREISDTGYWPDLSRGSPLRHVLEDIFFFQNATLVRRECYDAVGPFSVDLARSIDYDMTVRLMARFAAEVIPDTVFLQRKHDGARGPAWQRHAASKSEDVWRDADRMIFERLRPVLPISLYEAMFDSPRPDLKRRAAYLQRGAVYARRRDWDAAFEDFDAAIRQAHDLPLSPEECQIAIRALAAKHGAQELFTAPYRKRLMEISRHSAAGHSLARAMSRGAIWRLREAVQNRRAGEAFAVAWLLAQIPPMSRASANTPPKAANTEVTERDRLPAEAYAW